MLTSSEIVQAFQREAAFGDVEDQSLDGRPGPVAWYARAVEVVIRLDAFDPASLRWIWEIRLQDQLLSGVVHGLGDVVRAADLGSELAGHPVVRSALTRLGGAAEPHDTLTRPVGRSR